MVTPNNSAVLAERGLAIAPAASARFSTRRAYAQTFASMLAIRALGVVSGVLAARLLGPAGRGELAVIIFLPMLLVTLGELELPRSLAYEVSRVDPIPRSVIATSFWLAVLLGSLQAVVLAAVLPLYLPTDKLYLLSTSRWFMLYLPAAFITATLLGSDQGKGRFGRFSIFLALPGIFYVATVLLAWASGRVSLATFAAGILGGVIMVAAMRTGVDWDSISNTLPDWGTAQRLLKRGLGFYVPAAASFALSRADMFLLVRVAPSEAIGFYSVAQAIALGQIGAVNPFLQVGFSAVAGETDPQQALQTAARHFRFSQLLVIGGGLLAALATPWLIRVMFGARFQAAVVPTYLLIASTVLWGLEQVLEQGLRAANHPLPGILSNLLGLVILGGLGIPACLRYGIVGLASATIAAQFLNLAVLIGFCLFSLYTPLGAFWGFGASTVKELVQSFGHSFVECLPVESTRRKSE